MKIADVTVGTEYAYTSGQYDDTYWVRLERASRVLVTAIHPGGKVSIETWDRASKTFRVWNSRPVSARGLVMRWDDAQPIYKEIRERREAQAKFNREQKEREQAALRAVGEFLENHDALGMSGLPYTLKGAIALANGDPSVTTQGTLTYARNRHEPKVEVNVVTLLALLRMAYGDGKDDWNREAAVWSQEVSS